MKPQNYMHAANRRGRLLIVGLCALLLAGASQAENRRLQAPGDSMWLAASDRTLDRLRGGFDLGAGFMVSFGISRSVYINDQLITTMSFQLGDITKITPAQAAVLGQQFAAQALLVQNGPGNTVETAAPAVPLAISIQNMPSNQPLRTQTVIQANSNGLNAQTLPQAQVVQNGPGNTAAPAALTAPATLAAPAALAGPNNLAGPATLAAPAALNIPLATIIQNTLNNQILRTQTVIQASTNALSALRSMNLQATIREAVANAIGNR